ncbi:hypothetical protein ACHAW5_009683 [Stephanodiscus triporus]|uniref:Acyl-coenzyme A thioesterase THEM4 n=1 Tax=Stephanodiscus triporus TaxID=2934178 RepID=A0ABD3NCV2_9STRA
MRVRQGGGAAVAGASAAAAAVAVLLSHYQYHRRRPDDGARTLPSPPPLPSPSVANPGEDRGRGARRPRRWCDARVSSSAPPTSQSSRSSDRAAHCEAAIVVVDDDENESGRSNDGGDDDDDAGYYYLRMDPAGLARTSLSDSHALFGALSGEGMIERYDVYRRVANDRDVVVDERGLVRRSPSERRELAVVNVRVGTKLNGHDGIVHGGILSLLFDEAMGWAYECLRQEEEEEDDQIDRTSLATSAVTANLTVDYRAPFSEGSEAVIRVRHDDSEGRKIYFAATLESKDGGVTYAEARSVFVIPRLRHAVAPMDGND